jgi:hypothetical protein
MSFQPLRFRLSVLVSLVIALLLVASASAQDRPKIEIVLNIPHSLEAYRAEPCAPRTQGRGVWSAPREGGYRKAPLYWLIAAVKDVGHTLQT